MRNRRQFYGSRQLAVNIKGIMGLHYMVSSCLQTIQIVASILNATMLQTENQLI